MAKETGAHGQLAAPRNVSTGQIEVASLGPRTFVPGLVITIERPPLAPV
jgi:hypothetical protein